jgi:PIN domain nuclease of toxin-antitoxin system
MKAPELLLLDTHAWLWLLEDNPRLGEAPRKVLTKAAKAGALRLSAISVFEVALLVRKRRLTLAGLSLDAWMEKALALPGLCVVPVDARIALLSQQLEDEFHPDPADRFIVATARLEACRLVTADTLILPYAARTGLPVLALG